ncbi:DUF2179 domain-containing protein [Teretinema zuelzerae]|uniref:DUF2179 domain-containing protein n=1 Tax=Teretinema zuelzerae TaxID=156 RepID=UPI001E4DD3B2|nr:DUF5698 domain-containing protein [Teretinema zuelzerae]
MHRGVFLFSQPQILLALTIFIARVADVSLGTFRHAMVIRGRKLPAFFAAFAESLIWVFAVSRVLKDMSDPLTAVAFALGFATGTFCGMTIENLFKIGDQVIRIFSAKGEESAASLREAGYRVTVFEGSGRDGAVSLLFLQAKRRDVSKIQSLARKIDPAGFIVIDDIRSASAGAPSRK